MKIGCLAEYKSNYPNVQDDGTTPPTTTTKAEEERLKKKAIKAAKKKQDEMTKDHNAFLASFTAFFGDPKNQDLIDGAEQAFVKPQKASNCLKMKFTNIYAANDFVTFVTQYYHWLFGVVIAEKTPNPDNLKLPHTLSVTTFVPNSEKTGNRFIPEYMSGFLKNEAEKAKLLHEAWFIATDGNNLEKWLMETYMGQVCQCFNNLSDKKHKEYKAELDKIASAAINLSVYYPTKTAN